MVEHENFGQDQLTLGTRVELADSFVAQIQQLLSGELLFVLLNALQDELLILTAQ
jgi:hypothetical protein